MGIMAATTTAIIGFSVQNIIMGPGQHWNKKDRQTMIPGDKDMEFGLRYKNRNYHRYFVQQAEKHWEEQGLPYPKQGRPKPVERYKG
jgi:hypothetical protein